MKQLKTGVAYHGNRMPDHAMTDMREISRAGMDIVVHMLSHTDWERHKSAMRDLFAISEAEGLEVWVDNWGLAGAPGDRSHFLAYHPEERMVFSDGRPHPYHVCLNSRKFRDFTKQWLDTVAELGGKTVFWDEPAIPAEAAPDGGHFHCCACPACKSLFAERYGRPMPEKMDGDCESFRTDTIVDFLSDITDYSASLGLKNTTCVMLGEHLGINLSSVERICSLPHLDSIGSDPYWLYSEGSHPYEYVYGAAKKTVGVADKYGKDHNVWIQSYGLPKGCEEEIIEATEAAYDAGARTILAWSFGAGASNDYRSENPRRSWDMTVEGMRRIKSHHRDLVLEENRKRFKK